MRRDGSTSVSGQREQRGMTPGMAHVLRLLAGRRLPLEDEKRTQAEIEAILAAEPDLLWAREVPVEGGIIDFVVDSDTGVEIKLRCRAAEVRRQLQRYARDARLRGLALVTARPVALPGNIGGKPVAVVDLGRAWL